MKKLVVKKYTLIDSELLSAWEKLWQATPDAHFFNSPDFFKTCVDAFTDIKIACYAFYLNDELVGVAPLTKSKKFGVSVLCSPGRRFLEKNTFLIKHGNLQILCEIVNYLSKQDNLFISEIDQIFASGLVDIVNNSFASIISINPFIEILSNPLRHLSKKQRSKIRNRIKKYCRQLEYKHFESNFDELLKAITTVESKSFKKLKKKDILSDEESQKYYKSLVNNAKKYLAFDVVYFRNNPIVYNLGLKFKNNYLAYHTAYHANFRKLSPGKVLLHFILNNLKRSGYEIFDFSRGHNALKKEFTPNFVLQYDFYYSRNSVVMVWWKCINFVRRAKAYLTRSRHSYDGDYLFRVVGNNKELERGLEYTKI